MNSSDSIYSLNSTMLIDEEAMYKVNFIIALFGVCSNLVCIYVLSKWRLKKFKFNWYLYLLAYTESFFCLFYFCNKLLLFSYGTNSKNFNTIVEVFNILTHVLNYFSIWIILLLSINRFYAVKYPYKIKDNMRNRHPRLVTMIIFIWILLFTLAGSVPFYVIEARNDRFSNIAMICRYLITPLLLWLTPCLAIFILNLLVILLLVNHSRLVHKNKSKFTNQNATTSTENESKIEITTVKSAVQLRSISHKQKLYAYLLLIMSIISFFTNAVIHTTSYLVSMVKKDNYFNYWVISTTIFIISHSLNLFLYMIFHRDFRCYLLKIILRPCNKKINLKEISSITNEEEEFELVLITW